MPGGSQLINIRTGEKRYFSQSQIIDAIRSGEWRGDSESLVHLVREDGGSFTTTGDQLDWAVNEVGAEAQTQEYLDHREREAELKAKYDDGFWTTGRAFVEGAARGLTFGGSDYLLREFGASTEGLRERRARNTAAAVGEIGSVVGATILSGGLAGAAKGAAKGTGVGAGIAGALARTPPAIVARGATRAGKLIGGTERVLLPLTVAAAAEGTIFGAGQGLSTVALAEDPMTAEALWDEMSAGAINGGILGAAAGGALGLLGKAGGAFQQWRLDKRGAALDAAGEELQHWKQVAIDAEAKKTAARGAKGAEREAGKGATAAGKTQAAAERTAARAAKDAKSELEKVRKQVGKEAAAEEAKVATAEKLVTKSKKELDTASTRMAETADSATAQQAKNAAKRKYHEAREELAKAKKSQSDQRELANAQIRSAKKGSAARAKAGKGEVPAGKNTFTRDLEDLDDAVGGLHKKGYSRITREFDGTWTPELEASSRNLKRLRDEFEKSYVTFAKRTKRGREGRRIVRQSDDILLQQANASPGSFELMIKRIDDVEAAYVAHHNQIERSIFTLKNPGGDLAAFEAKLPRTMHQITGKEMSASEWLKAMQAGVESKGGATTLDMLAGLEAADEISGTHLDDDIPVVGKLAEVLTYFRGFQRGPALLSHGAELVHTATGGAKAAKKALEGTEMASLVQKGEALQRKVARAADSEATKRAAVVDAEDLLKIAQAEREPTVRVAKLAAAQKAYDEAIDAVHTVKANTQQVAEANKVLAEARAATTAAEKEAVDAQLAKVAAKLATGATGSPGGMRKAVAVAAGQGTYTSITRIMGRNPQGAFIGAGLADKVRKAVNGGAGVGERVGGAYKTIATRIGDGVEGLLKASGKAAPYAHVPVITTLNRLSFRDKDEERKRATYDSKMTPTQRAFAGAADDLEKLMADPERAMELINRSVSPIRAVDAKLADEIAANQMRYLQNVYSRMPKNPLMGQPGGSYDRHIHPDHAIAKWVRYAAIAEHPTRVFAEMRSLRLTKEQADAVRENAPEILGRIQLNFIKKMTHGGKYIPFAVSSQISILLGQPFDTVQRPKHGGVLQGTFTQEPEPKPAPQADLTGIRNSINNQKTATQRRAE